jgi:hypothetical protein
LRRYSALLNLETIQLRKTVQLTKAA